MDWCPFWSEAGCFSLSKIIYKKSILSDRIMGAFYTLKRGERGVR